MDPMPAIGYLNVAGSRKLFIQESLVRRNKVGMFSFDEKDLSSVLRQGETGRAAADLLKMFLYGFMIDFPFESVFCFPDILQKQLLRLGCFETGFNSVFYLFSRLIRTKVEGRHEIDDFTMPSTVGRSVGYGSDIDDDGFADKFRFFHEYGHDYFPAHGVSGDAGAYR